MEAETKTIPEHGEHFNESIVNEVILEDMKKNRIDHMKYLPGMNMIMINIRQQMCAGHWRMITVLWKIFRHCFLRQHCHCWKRLHRQHR